jgi:hypothetical protein
LELSLLRSVHIAILFLLILLGQIAVGQNTKSEIIELDPPVRLRAGRFVSHIKVEREYGQRETAVSLEDGYNLSTLVVNFHDGLYFMYRNRLKISDGRAQRAGTSMVGTPLLTIPALPENLIFQLARPVVIPLHWKKNFVFDAIEMTGGPSAPSGEQLLRLGTIHNGVFRATEGFRQMNSTGNTMFKSGSSLVLSNYIVDGEDSQGIFITLRAPRGISYAKIVSVPYAGGPPDFPPTELLIRSSSFNFRQNVEDEEFVSVRRSCAVLK